MGEKIAFSVSAFFNDHENIATLKTLKSLGLKITNPDFVSKKRGALPLDGLTFVITGTLPVARKELEELIERKGGRASSALSANTDYLVVGEAPGSKLQKARTLAVKTIPYDELLKLIERRTGDPGLFT